jgi:hypothetical protein
LLRPLSAKLLPPTIAEREGVVDRDTLYDFNGRGRSGLIALAKQLGIRQIPQPSTGCALAERTFAPRVRDLLQFQPQAARWDFELLNVGRHLRFDPSTKVVVGRNAQENALIQGFFQRADAPQAALLHPEDFLGPEVLIVGPVTDPAVEFAGGLMVRFCWRADPERSQVRLTHLGAWRVVPIRFVESAASARLI